MAIGLFAAPFGVGDHSACVIGKASPDQVVGGGASERRFNV